MKGKHVFGEVTEGSTKGVGKPDGKARSVDWFAGADHVLQELREGQSLDAIEFILNVLKGQAKV